MNDSISTRLRRKIIAIKGHDNETRKLLQDVGKEIRTLRKIIKSQANQLMYVSPNHIKENKQCSALFGRCK